MTKPREKWTKENQDSLYKHLLLVLFDDQGEFQGALQEYLESLYSETIYDQAYYCHYGFENSLFTDQ